MSMGSRDWSKSEMGQRQRSVPLVLLFGLVPVATWFIVRPLLDPVPPLGTLYTSVGFSIFAFLATLYLVPALGPTFVKANLKGIDLLKVDKTPMYVRYPIQHPFRFSG